MSQRDDSGGMPAPEWVGDAKSALYDALGQHSFDNQSFRPRDLSPVTNFSTFFGEWEVKEEDILIHLFPRAGAEDRWTDGHYIPRCRRCRREAQVLEHSSEGAILRVSPCSCGHRGLIYIPGRREARSEKTNFPLDVATRIKQAADHVWEGELALEFVEELGAWVAQLQRAGSLKEDLRLSMLGWFFHRLDELLETTSS